MKFKLLPETLFLTINLLDRYTERKQIVKLQYQAVGGAALLIASKYEEIYPPEISDLEYCSEGAIKKDLLLKLEEDMLRTLDFNITPVTHYRLLERIHKLSNSDDLVFNLAQFLIELTIIDTKTMRKSKPSLLVSSAVYLAKKILGRTEPWNSLM